MFKLISKTGEVLHTGSQYSCLKVLTNIAGEKSLVVDVKEKFKIVPLRRI